MKQKSALLLLVAILCSSHVAAKEADTLVLGLRDVIALARQQSPSAQSARNAFLSAYWNYRYFRANQLPSVTLSSAPYINKEMNKIAQPDGTAQFLQQNQFGADLTLKVSQQVSWTGGSFFLKSTLNRIDEYRQHTTAYSCQPLLIGYEQSLFGYNSQKWDRRIEPIRYREAKKQYAGMLETISANACDHFFALATAQATLDMARQNFAAADTLYSMAQGRYEIGTITQNEMLQLEINRLNEETNVMDAEIELMETAQRLRSFLALPPTAELRLILPDSVPPFQVSLPQAMQLALANSYVPEYYRRIQKESESNLSQAKANRGFRADLYLQFGLSQTGSELRGVYRNLMNQEYAGISLSIPLLDWGRGKGRVKVAQSQLALTQTEVEQGMAGFRQTVQELVLQFNMQARKVRMASLTDQRAEQRHRIAQRLYILGRSSILDLNAAVSEKNAAKLGYVRTLKTYWNLYYTLRSLTAYDFEFNAPLTEQIPL